MTAPTRLQVGQEVCERLSALSEFLVGASQLVVHAGSHAVGNRRKHEQIKRQCVSVFAQLVVVARKVKRKLVRHSTRANQLELLKRPRQAGPIGAFQRALRHVQEIGNRLVGVARVDSKEARIVVARLVEAVEMRIAVGEPQQDAGFLTSLAERDLVLGHGRLRTLGA